MLNGSSRPFSVGRTGVPRRVAVLGGGIAGLASAYYLLQAGHRPVVFEAANKLGGLGSSFAHDGVQLDCFYHVILESDAELRAVIEQLGLTDRLVWRGTGMGFLIGDTLYPFNGALDLLRFGALSPVERLRTGLGALYVTRLRRDTADLDRITALEWLRRVFGASVCERIWVPLLRAKFGDRFDAIPAYWVCNLLRREKNGSQEIKGYLRGGYQTLADRLHRAIVRGGGDVRLSSAVLSLAAEERSIVLRCADGSERFDAAIATVPLPLLARVATGELAAEIPHLDLRYQGVVNALVLLRRPLERFYWTVVMHPSFPFAGVVETTHVIPPEWVGGRHLAYLMNYCSADSEIYQRPDDLVRQQALHGLGAAYRSFDPSMLEAVYVFRAPHVEPVWTLDYLRMRPAPRVGRTRLYLSTTAQAYPRVTAWNTSVRLARDTVTALIADLRRDPRLGAPALGGEHSNGSVQRAAY